MLRLIIIAIVIFIFAVPLGLPAMLFFWLLGLVSPTAQADGALAYLRTLMALIIFFSGVRLTVYGKENIPKKGACLFVANHRSFYDIFIQYQFIRRTCGTVSKIEWGRIPILRTYMKFIHCLFLDRKSLRAGVEVNRQMEEELRAGHAFMIYPEGTRGHLNGLLPFHEGSFKSAFATGSPVVPVTFVHTDDIFENHIPFVRPTNVTVVFGTPVSTSGLSRAEHKELSRKIHDQMEKTYLQYV